MNNFIKTDKYMIMLVYTYITDYNPRHDILYQPILKQNMDMDITKKFDNNLILGDVLAKIIGKFNE